jgi:deoxyadenosine/deoxycytidine kinase
VPKEPIFKRGKSCYLRFFFALFGGGAGNGMANLFEEPKFIVVEGPIRVGKSSLAKALATQLHARHIAEPEHNPFLERFYRGAPSMAFPAQMWFLKERHEQMLALGREQEAKVAGAWQGPVIADYLFEKDKLFAYVNLTDAELDLYNRYYQMLRHDVPRPDLVIYLQASSEVLKQRIKRKGVTQERALSDDYIHQVVEAYEHFFFHYSASDLLVVDTTQLDFVHRNQDLQLLLKRLSGPIKGTQYFLPLGAEDAAS